jgi:putative thiamine transport system ATP-binding protein
MMTADQALFLDQVSISLGGRVLVALTHRVAPGEVLTVMGPSAAFSIAHLRQLAR